MRRHTMIRNDLARKSQEKKIVKVDYIQRVARPLYQSTSIHLKYSFTFQDKITFEPLQSTSPFS